MSHTSEMEIRALDRTDADAYWNLRQEALQMEPFAYGTSAEAYITTTVKEAAERIASVSPDGFLLGALDEGALVGMAMFERETGAKERHKGHIRGVYLRAAYRGQGIGRELVAALLDRAKNDSSLEHILLAVGTRQQAALHLYRQFGFVLYGTEPRAIKVGSAYADEEQMILMLR